MNPWTSHPHDCLVFDQVFHEMLAIARHWQARREQAAELAAKP